MEAEYSSKGIPDLNTVYLITNPLTKRYLKGGEMGDSE
jgi:hypothetical protein